MRNFSFRWHTDRHTAVVLAWIASIVAGVLLLVQFFLLREAWPALQNGGLWRFFDADGWYPREGHLGLLPMFWATLAAAGGAVLLATPLGVACAVFTVFYASPRFGRWLQQMLALMAGVPSVVFGLWGLTALVPLINQWHPPGTSLLAAMLVLALMILPTVAISSTAALSAVHEAWLRGADALALSARAKILGVAIPAARRGILVGILLAMVRALGETMAVVMVAGNVVQIPDSVFDPVRVLTANIALEMAYATGEHRAALFVSGWVLCLLVFTLALLAIRLNIRSTAHG